MNIITEICSADAGLIKGWRYLFSKSYRTERKRKWKTFGRIRVYLEWTEIIIYPIAEILLVYLLFSWSMGA